MDFREHVRSKILSTNDRILEFGPLNRPTATKDKFPNVKFADIRSTEDIKKLYTSNDYLKATGVTVDIDSIVEIDYVIKDSYENTFKGAEKFDAIILSHVIEHIPDIIGFFTDVATILKDNGKLVIVYPDARYCFDHFRNGTRFIDAYEVYKKKASNAAGVFDFAFNVVKENDAAFFWESSGIMKTLPENIFSDSMVKYKQAEDGELPDDVHYWPFSDYQFAKFLYDMDRAGLLRFNMCDFFATQNNTQEFMVIMSLKQSNIIEKDKYKSIMDATNQSIALSRSRQSAYRQLGKNVKLKANLLECQAALGALEKRLDDAAHKTSALLRRSDILEGEKKLLESEKRKLTKRLNLQSKELEDIRNSSSWKITSPLRRISERIAKIKKGAKR